MNRRNFLSMMVGGVAAAAAVRTFPFRVFSFPKEIKVAQCVPKEIVALWKQRLDLIGCFGTDSGAEWWMHPAQLAALKQLGFAAYAYPELRASNGLKELAAAEAFGVRGQLIGIPVRECPHMDPKEPAVLHRSYRELRTVVRPPTLDFCFTQEMTIAEAKRRYPNAVILRN